MADIKKKKDGSWTIFALTVSPTTGSASLDDLKKVYKIYCKKYKKNIKSSAYALELGQRKAHPHIHMLFEFTKSSRIGNRRKHFESFWGRALKHEITENFIGKKGCVAAHAPHYYFKKYMQKENIEFQNDGFEIDKLKKAANVEKTRYQSMGKSRISIHRGNFMEVFSDIIHTDKFGNHPIPFKSNMNKYIQYLIKYLWENGFSVTFILYNKKQVCDALYILLGQYDRINGFDEDI